MTPIHNIGYINENGVITKIKDTFLDDQRTEWRKNYYNTFIKFLKLS